MNLDNKLFELIAYNMESYIEYYANGTSRRRVKNTIVELEQCDKTFSNKSEFAELNLSNYICIKRGQNMTAFGLLGDKNNLYKGLRVYINKCSGRDCYDDDVIEKQFHNSKFYLYYLGLSSNMFYLNSEDVKYQILTKFCSLSTTVLKKIVFTFDIGRFHLYNNILFKNNVSINYLLGNDYSIDVDIDPTSTLKADEYTIAYISFHYGGNIIETRKEVQTLFESLSIIGNVFNIILTIFKVINNYYSNKILFIDIFYKFFFENRFRKSKTVHFDKDNSKKENHSKEGKDFLSRKSHKNLLTLQINNKDKNKSITSNFDSSIYLDNFAKSNKNLNILNIKSGRNFTNQPKSKRSIHLSNKTIIKEKNEFIKFSKFYYLFPRCCIKNKKNLDNLLFIKNSICSCFSLETFIEFAKFKKAVSTRGKNKNNSFVFDEKNWVSSKNFKEEISKIFGL